MKPWVVGLMLLAGCRSETPEFIIDRRAKLLVEMYRAQEMSRLCSECEDPEDRATGLEWEARAREIERQLEADKKK
jgi:hypothetical protein